MRFSSIALGSVFVLAIVGCGDDSSSSSGSGGSGTTSGTATATSTTASSTTASTTASTASGTGGDGSGGDSSSSTGDGGGSTGTSTSSQGGGAGTGGSSGQGGGAGVCAETCSGGAQPDADCQTCLQDEAFSTCQGEGLACAQAAAGPNDSKGCLTCLDYAQGGFAGTLCESNTDLLNDLIVCVCEACG